jgi:hypothetical protein
MEQLMKTGDTITEAEIRRDAANVPRDFVDALVSLWKQGRIIPTGRDSAGHIIWQATPGGDAN